MVQPQLREAAKASMERAKAVIISVKRVKSTVLHHLKMVCYNMGMSILEKSK
jgi:ribosomal protein S5